MFHLLPSLEPFQTEAKAFQTCLEPKALREHNWKSGHLWECYRNGAGMVEWWNGYDGCQL